MNSRQQQIRRLIDRFYAGLTDVGEEREIIRYFSETPVEEISPELLGERQFFIALYDAFDPSAITERETGQYPGVLADRIEEAIRREALKEQAAASLRRRRIWRVSGMAASFALLIGVAAGIAIDTGSRSDGKQTALARTESLVDAKESTTAEIPQPYESSEPNTQSAAMPRTKPAPAQSAAALKTAHAAAVTAPQDVQESADPAAQTGIREVTDPQEAEAILAKVEALIAANVDAGTSALDNAGRMFGREMEKVDKIKTMDI